MEQAEQVRFELEIEKAIDEDGQRIIYLHAYTEKEDLQHETIYMDALKKSANYFLQNGFLDYHHVGERNKQVPDPQDIIGYPLELKFKGNDAYVKAVLHKGDKIADEVWNGLNCKPPKRFRASIAGKRIKTFKQDNGVYTTELIWTSLAITPSPVNMDTSVSTADTYSAFLKALVSSAETDLAQVKGGQALSGVRIDDEPARIIAKDCGLWCDGNGAFKKGLQKKDIVTYVTRYLGLGGEIAKSVCKTLWLTYNPTTGAKGRKDV